MTRQSQSVAPSVAQQPNVATVNPTQAAPQATSPPVARKPLPKPPAADAQPAKPIPTAPIVPTDPITAAPSSVTSPVVNEQTEPRIIQEATEVPPAKLDWRQKLAERRREAARVQAEKERAEQEAARLQAEKERAEQEEAERRAQQQREEQEAAVRRAEQQRAEEAARLQAKRERAEQEIARLKAEQERITQELAILQDERKQAERDTQLLSDNNSLAQQKADKLEAARKQAEEEVARIEAEQKQAEEKAAEFQAQWQLAEEEVAKLYAELLSAEQKVADHRAERQQALEEASGLQDKLALAEEEDKARAAKQLLLQKQLQEINRAHEVQALNIMEVPGVSFDMQEAPLDPDHFALALENLREHCKVDTETTFHIYIQHRATLVNDTIKALDLPPEGIGKLQNRLLVVFEEEEAVDAGGLAVELFSLFGQGITSPEMGIFSRTTSGTVFINPESTKKLDGPEAEDYKKRFRVFGRYMGICLLNQMMIPVDFHPAFFKAILDEPVNALDFKLYDKSGWNSLFGKVGMLKWEDYMFGEEYIFIYDHDELIPGGLDIEVTTENVRTYAKMTIEFVLRKNIQRQIQLIKQGIFDVIPEEYISEFTGKELATALQGSAEIDITDWQDHVEYNACCENSEEGHKVVLWFWKYVMSLPQEKLRALLMFITGSSQVPYGGFSKLRDGHGKLKPMSIRCSSIYKAIQSETCFNYLNLPTAIDDEEEFRKFVDIAIENCTGFDES